MSDVHEVRLTPAGNYLPTATAGARYSRVVLPRPPANDQERDYVSVLQTRLEPGGTLVVASLSRRFHLQRDTDVSGISGTGVVADGVRFPDGVCVIRWRGDRQSTVVWPSVEDVEAIHGHGGATRIVWDD